MLSKSLEETELRTKSTEGHDSTGICLERYKLTVCFINGERRGEKGKRVEGNVGHKRSFVGMVYAAVSTMLSFLWRASWVCDLCILVRCILVKIDFTKIFYDSNKSA